MEETKTANKGYQKQIKKQEAPPIKKSANVSYGSPLAQKWPVLIEAVEKGDVEAIKKLIEEGLNVNQARSGLTPLMAAASAGQAEAGRVILESGVNINEKNDDGWTALHKAAFDQAGTPVVDLLLEFGINADEKDRFGKTALMLAEEKKHLDIARAIKKRQEQLLADAREWKEFLDSADGKPYKMNRLLEIMNSYLQLLWVPPLALGGLGLLFGFIFGVVKSIIVGVIIGAFADGAFYLRMAVIRKYLDEFGSLPELDIHLLREKRKAGESTAIQKKIEAEPVDAGPTPTADIVPEFTPGVTVAEIAPAEENSDRIPPGIARRIELRQVAYAAAGIILVALVGFGAVYRTSITKWYFAKKLERSGVQFSGPAYLDAIARNDAVALSLFLKAGMTGDVRNDKGQTGLIIAAEKGHLNLITALLKANPSQRDQPDAAGMTPLMTAARRGRENVVRALIESGSPADLVVSGREQAATALQAVLDADPFSEGHLRIVQYLLEKGADVKTRNAAGRSPLLFAAARNRVDAAKLLQGKGADVNEADAKGENALLIAACKGYTDFISFLLAQGANVNSTAVEGQTALMCAAREGHAATVNILIGKGATIDGKTAKGGTALTEASSAGNAEVVKLLLEKGADPAAGYVPDPFLQLKGQAVLISAKKKRIGAVLKRIADAAAKDGYAIRYDPALAQRTTLNLKGPWNTVLTKVAGKGRLFLLIKEKEIQILPYTPLRRAGTN